MIFQHIYNQILISFQLCLIEIWSNRLRTIITSFGIFLGVASFLINVSFIRGLDDNIKQNLEEIGGLNMITINKKEASSEQETIIFDKSSGLKLQEIQDICKELPYIKSVLPKEDIPWQEAKAENKSTFVKPFAVTKEYFDAFNYEIQDGRPFTVDDNLKQQNVCIIGSRIIKELFPDEQSVIGKSVTLMNHSFIIIGTIKTEDDFSYKAIQFLFPYNFYLYRFGNSQFPINDITVELTNSQFANKAQIELTRYLKEKHRGIEDFTVETNQSKIEEMRIASMGIKVLCATISIITLVIGGISIMNIMFAAIGDRIREIGLRKALGARKQDIFLQFIIEAIVVSCVGGIPGLVLGSTIILLPKGIFPFNPNLTFADFSMALTFTIFAGIISGLSPALKAASMQPVDALRY